MAGGAERVISFLARNLNSEFFESKLIVIGSKNNIAYDISEINTTFLQKERVLYSIPALIKTIRKEKPQIVLGTVLHLNAILSYISYLFRGVVFVGRQAGISKVSFHQNHEYKKSLFSVPLEKVLKRLDYVICQSQDMAHDCIEEFNVEKSRIKVIQNPITDNFKIKQVLNSTENKVYKFVTVGRLARIKGHQRIIKILSKIKVPFVYTIIGDGPLKDEIFNEAERLGLTDNIKHIPFTNEVAVHLSENDYFLQGSLSEGFPNSLLESCAVGTPVLAFDVPGGTKEIVENGINGYLVNSEEEFLERLNNLPSFDPTSVSESVFKKFAKEIILNEYESFFLNIIDE